MKETILRVALFVGLSCAMGQVTAQEVSMKCHNPPLDVKFDVNRTRASSQPVQFNIVRDATSGTVFVNSDNNGVCIAKLDRGHVFTGSSFVIRPGGSWTEGYDNNPELIEKTVKIGGIKTGNQEMTFNVIHNESSLKGNITVTFFVNYE